MFTHNSNKYPSSHDQILADLIKWPLLKCPIFHYQESKFTKHLSFMTIEGDTLIQIQKWSDVILSAFFQSFSTNKICSQ